MPQFKQQSVCSGKSRLPTLELEMSFIEKQRKLDQEESEERPDGQKTRASNDRRDAGTE